MEFNLAAQRMTPNIRTILEDRYLMKDENETIIETPDGMYIRVADHIGKNEEERKTYYIMMASGDFQPNSPTLVNAGANKGCLSACFVRSPEDDMVDIMRVISDVVMIEKWGGGIGIGVSKIRPKGTHIGTVHGQALGPINVLKMISSNANMITQGSFRRGAHMGQLIISHPDIQEFIHCKDNFEELQNFNISVQITDDFMNSVLNDKNWDLIDPHTQQITKTLKARDLWNEICESAHATGDPGIAFIDRVWETQPNPQLGNIMTSNPCGEEYLEDGNSCCLGSINLSNFVSSDGNGWDHDRLDRVVHNAVNFLNGVIDVNEFPLQSLRDINLATRRIGLGIMGWADALIKLGIPYDSPGAIVEAKFIGSAISASAWDASAELAIKDGPYPEWENSAFNVIGAKPVRNSSVITIAPTGTISRLADCSSGIEPLFDLVWESNILWKDDTGESTTKMMDCAKGIRDHINGLGYKVEDILKNYKPKELFTYFTLDEKIYQTALNISPEAHLEMQAAWQENTSNAVSKTINAPNDMTIEEIKDIYFQAWELQCKGVTIYRSGTREVEVLSTLEQKVGEMFGKTIATTEEEELMNKLEDLSTWGRDEGTKPVGNIKRPHSVYGVTDTWNTGHGKLLVTANWNGKPHEVIANGGKAGGCDTAFLETIARLVSLALQKGIDYEDIAYQMNGITCCPAWDDGKLVLSPADAISKTMREHFSKVGKEEQKEQEETNWKDVPTTTALIFHSDPQKIDLIDFKKCQSCNGRMIPIDGCLSCQACGKGKCD